MNLSKFFSGIGNSALRTKVLAPNVYSILLFLLLFFSFSNTIPWVLPLSPTIAIKNYCTILQHNRHFLTYWPWPQLSLVCLTCPPPHNSSVGKFHSCPRYISSPQEILSHTITGLFVFFLPSLRAHCV